MADSYKEFTLNDLEALQKICGTERVIPRENIGEDYSHDELSGVRSYPDVLVKAVSTEEVSQVMKYAFANNIPVTPRGSGTGLVGGSVALCGGIMLDLTLMNHFLELDEENMTLTLEPGVLLMDVGKYVEGRSLLSSGSRRKDRYHRRQYQYQCRRYAGCEVRRDARLYPRT